MNQISIDQAKSLALTALEDVKGKDIVCLDTKTLTSLFDCLIVASGDSNRQVKALANNVRESLKEAGWEINGMEGEMYGEWVLVDAGPIVIHVMQPAVRDYYNIEQLWGGQNPALPRFVLGTLQCTKKRCKHLVISMRLTILSISHKLPSWQQTGIDEYAKRFSKDWPLTFKILTPGKRISAYTSQQIMQEEAERLKHAIPKLSRIVAMDEKGERHSTKSMSEQLKHWDMEGIETTFIIGGTDGLDPSIKQSAENLWRLSDLTLPHGLAKLLLVEQLYRSIAILQNHPYHRE